LSGALPVVAVVGRPNVGKSTFFNRVIGHRLAIVDDRPGVTRDRNFARADWNGRTFFIVDTGGVVEGSDEPLDRSVRDQALAAVQEADVILFLVDGKAGVHPLDERLGEILRAPGKPVLLVVNKMDNLPHDSGHHDFWRLGLGDPLPVSAISGKGSGDLLDRIVECLPEREAPADEPGVIRVAVVGKPNVGKSSFVNRLLGEDRVVVSEVAGTTRDSVDTPMRYHDQTLILVDTAGLRRQARVKDSLEYYSALRTARVVQEADVCLVLVDGTEPLHVQDLRVAEQAWDAGAGVILAVNKWDLVEKETQTAPNLEKEMRKRAPFLQWMPILFLSALTGQRVRKTLDLVLEVQAQRQRRIETHEVNEALSEIVGRQPPPHSRGRAVKIRYGTQVAVAPPTFVLFSNLPKEIPEHYIRYIHNGFRERWGFSGTPIRIRLRPSTKESPRP
jgi:GTPase